MATNPGYVWWVGADGNVWQKSSSGTVNMGNQYSIDGTGNALFDGGGLQSAQRINDPNPPAATAPSNPNGSTGPAYQDKSNDIAIQNAGVAAADTQKNTGLAAVDTALGGLIGQYDTEKTANEGNYGTQSDTNRNNLQTNKQTALVNAAQGRRGLFGTLASLGALNGSGIDLANHAVQTGANEDLTGAEGNFGSNQTTLDNAIGAFRADDERRRTDAKTAATNARAKVAHDTAVSKQGFYSNLANDYSAMGDSGNASRFTGMAADLYPEVANTSIPDTTALTAEHAAFTPGTLGTYLAGQGSTIVRVAPTAGTGAGGSILPGLTAANNNENKKKQIAALVPAAA
jgi:hypothetical protein